VSPSSQASGRAPMINEEGVGRVISVGETGRTCLSRLAGQYPQKSRLREINRIRIPTAARILRMQILYDRCLLPVTVADNCGHCAGFAALICRRTLAARKMRSKNPSYPSGSYKIM